MKHSPTVATPAVVLPRKPCCADPASRPPVAARRAQARPEFLCRACGRRGCRCHVARRLHHARPAPLPGFHTSHAPRADLQGHAIVETPLPRPCRPQGPPCAFSDPPTMPFGKGQHRERPTAY